ncbi:MAG: hypothetical protein LBV12_06855 [Puniceicoccales bacterium]|jgi:hypothetical protein|nr:hypothetical protein [Puniceicoccales bacterium]
MHLATKGESFNKFAQLILVLLCGATIMLIPLKIAGLGYLPGDDALRHAAYAVDNREWSEVLVLNPALNPKMDSHPGWHAVLRFVHRTLNIQQDGLVVLAFTATFVGFMFTGLIASRSPLAWLVASGVMLIMEPSIYSRLLLGRPFAVSMAVLVILLFFWLKPEKRSLFKESAIVFSLLTVSVLMHPTIWYLWSIPIFALWIAGQKRSSLITAGCIPFSMIAAALILGDWYDIFIFPLYAIFNSVGIDNIIVTNLVTELQPNASPVFSIALIAAILIIRKMRGEDVLLELKKVDFLLIILGWLLGLAVTRFWLDWGIPALMVWICRQMLFVDKLAIREKWTVAVIGMIAMFLGIGSDLGGRYTMGLKTLTARPVDQFQESLPDRGGILYCADMTPFYSIYFKLPHDHFFRFILGYEPGLMPPDDLKTLRAIQSTNGALAEYEPWFQKMNSADRVLISSVTQPEKEGFEFARFFNYWIGRKLPATSTSSTKSS